jgi:hypothetical protein
MGATRARRCRRNAPGGPPIPLGLHETIEIAAPIFRAGQPPSLRRQAPPSPVVPATPSGVSAGDSRGVSRVVMCLRELRGGSRARIRARLPPPRRRAGPSSGSRRAMPDLYRSRSPDPWTPRPGTVRIASRPGPPPRGGLVHDRRRSGAGRTRWGRTDRWSRPGRPARVVGWLPAGDVRVGVPSRPGAVLDRTVEVAW